MINCRIHLMTVSNSGSFITESLIGLYRMGLENDNYNIRGYVDCAAPHFIATEESTLIKRGDSQGNPVPY